MDAGFAAIAIGYLPLLPAATAARKIPLEIQSVCRYNEFRTLHRFASSGKKIQGHG